MIYTEISNEDKELLKSSNCVIRTKLVITNNKIDIHNTNDIPNDAIILTEENSVKTWEHTEDRYVPDEGFIGQFVARTLTGELQNISDSFNIENKYIDLQLGVSQFNQNKTNWYSLGQFLVSKPSDDEVSDNTQFESFDLTILFNKQFNPFHTDTEFTESFQSVLDRGSYFTNKQLAKYVCNQVGVEFGTTSFIHDNWQIYSNQFSEDASCRDVMKAISKLAFGYVKIGWDNKCYIENLSTSYTGLEQIDYDQYYSLTTQKEMYGPVNNVSVGFSSVEGNRAYNPNESSISQNGETLIEILDNPLVYNSDMFQDAVNGSEILWGIKYTPLSTETIGHIWFNAKTPIIVKDMEQNVLYTHPFINTIKYFGHIKTDIESIANTKVDEEYGYDDSLSQEVKRTRIMVDNAKGEITQLSGRVNANDELIDGMQTKLTDTSYDIQRIEQKTSKLDEEGNATSVKISTDYSFTSDGLIMAKSDTGYNATYTNEKTEYRDGDKVLQRTDRNGTITKDMVLYGTYYYGVHEDVNLDPFDKDDAMFVGQMYTDENNEECFGHFYNGGNV